MKNRRGPISLNDFSMLERLSRPENKDLIKLLDEITDENKFISVIKNVKDRFPSLLYGMGIMSLVDDLKSLHWIFLSKSEKSKDSENTLELSVLIFVILSLYQRSAAGDE